MNALGYYQELTEEDQPALIKAVKFELTRAEGLTIECGPAAPVTTWKAADDILRGWARTAPDEGHGYDKCDFTVTYQDGETYSGRYDLKRHDMGFTDLLAHHIRSFVGFYAGTLRPDWMSEDKYQAALQDTGEETRKSYADFLARYEIGDNSSASAPVLEVVHDPQPEPEPAPEPKREKITDTTLVAKMVREQLKKEFPSCKFSVTSKYFSGGSELSIALMSAPFEVMQDTPHWQGYAQLNHNTLRRPFEEFTGQQHNCDGWYTVPEGYAVCNGAYLTRKGWEVLARAVEIGQAENWDHSDIQTDYFDVNYYFDIQVGKWNKEFTIK